MPTIERITQFKRDFKREQRGRYRRTLQTDLIAILEDLASDRALAPHLRDHSLMGNWKDHRDCHVRPDLVLIYRLVGGTILQLVRLGLHSELGS